MYDVNSLFPWAMLQPLPLGLPKPWDTSKGLQDFFGIAEVEVECPSDIKIPVLPLKVNINGAEKLIFPTGKFRGVYWSFELKYAQEQLGYNIKLIRAYSFEQSNNLFKDYVSNFYNKKSSSENGAIRAISKLMLNSLYGRFAIRREFESYFITSNEYIKDQLLNVFTSIKPEPLDNKSVLFSFSSAPNLNLKDTDSYIFNLLNKLFLTSNEGRVGNIAIASAITAYSRVYMHQIKQRLVKENIEIYYQDTDALVISDKMPQDLIGSELGL
jgi:hypothetical protein